MYRKLAVLFFAACFSIVGVSVASAQGRGAGMGRGLGHAASSSAAAMGRGGSSSALQNAANGMATAPSATATRHHSHVLPRDLNQVSGVAAGVGRSARGLERSTAALPGMAAQRTSPQPGGQPLGNFERIQQSRLQQAEHLRGIADRNGNEHLLDTAERMQTSANQGYQRQSGAQSPAAAPTPAAGAVPAPGTDTKLGSPSLPVNSATASATTAKGKIGAMPKRGFWFGSR